MNDLTFGFKHKGSPVDVIDNEYIYFHVFKENRYPDNTNDIVDIGLHHCDETSHLTNIYQQSVI